MVRPVPVLGRKRQSQQKIGTTLTQDWAIFAAQYTIDKAAKESRTRDAPRK
jgi:hypothetical protein